MVAHTLTTNLNSKPSCLQNHHLHQFASSLLVRISIHLFSGRVCLSLFACSFRLLCLSLEARGCLCGMKKSDPDMVVCQDKYHDGETAAKKKVEDEQSWRTLRIVLGVRNIAMLTNSKDSSPFQHVFLSLALKKVWLLIIICIFIQVASVINVGYHHRNKLPPPRHYFLVLFDPLVGLLKLIGLWDLLGPALQSLLETGLQ